MGMTFDVYEVLFEYYIFIYWSGHGLSVIQTRLYLTYMCMYVCADTTSCYYFWIATWKNLHTMLNSFFDHFLGYSRIVSFSDLMRCRYQRRDNKICCQLFIINILFASLNVQAKHCLSHLFRNASPTKMSSKSKADRKESVDAAMASKSNAERKDSVTAVEDAGNTVVVFKPIVKVRIFHGRCHKTNALIYALR